MGLFDSVIAGAVGAEMAVVVNRLIENHGGVQGVISQFERQGFGPTVRTWVGTGANQPITADQIHRALGPDTVNQLAAKLGIPPAELAKKLTEVLPAAVNTLTPAGVIPKT